MTHHREDKGSGLLRTPMSRRELLGWGGKLGLGSVGATLLMNTLSSQALAQSSAFDWKKHQGKTVRLLLNKHPYADAVIQAIDNFKELTGMDVQYDIFPEDVYFDKVTATLTSQSDQYDIIMTGAYQTWQYGPAGWLVDLNEFIDDPNQTAESYRWQDVLPNIRNSLAWSGQVGDPLGGENAKQWAVPLGFEQYSVSYNRQMLEKAGMAPPENLPDLIDKSAALTRDGVYGIGVRGSRSWATIHPGFLSGYVNYGARDFVTENGKLKAAMNSPESKEFTKLWVDMIKQGGPPDWTTYTWYEVGNDLGAGASAMIYDADIIGFFQNVSSGQSGNIGYHAFTPNPEASSPTSNVWIWSMAMSNFSSDKPAAWYFLQWATSPQTHLYGATEAQMVDPVRQSVVSNAEFQERMESDFPGYLPALRKTAEQAQIYFTPQPLFFNVTTQWAAELQRMYGGQVSVDEGLDQLAETIDRQLSSVGIT